MTTEPRLFQLASFRSKRELALLQVTSLEDADKRIDELASSGKLDPALMLTMAKAYAAAKDTDYTKEEVKDVMAHLYFKVGQSLKP